MADTPRIAVLGCGGWGRNIVRAVRNLGALGAVVDPSPDGRQRAQERAPGVAVFSHPDPVLHDPGITGVMIATPAETHYALARRALEAGKDVFVEKPMTVRLDEATDLLARAEAADRLLMVGHLLEYHPAVQTLLELVRRGELGEIRYVISNRLNLGKVRTEENALWSFAPHDIAVILRLVGAMPVEVVATGGCYLQSNVADVTVTQLRFASGVRSHIFVSWLHPYKEQRLVVVGSRKMASFDDVAKRLVLHDQRVDGENGRFTPFQGDGRDVEFPADEPLRRECEHFLECVSTRRRPHTDGDNGVRVLRVLHASQRSLVAHGRPVQLEPGGEPRPQPEIETVAGPVTHVPV